MLAYSVVLPFTVTVVLYPVLAILLFKFFQKVTTTSKVFQNIAQIDNSLVAVFAE